MPVKAAQRLSRGERHRANQSIESNHSESEDVDGRETPILQVEERPVIGCRCHRGQGIVALAEDTQGVRMRRRRMLGIDAKLVPGQRCQARSRHNRRGAAPTAVGRHKWRLVESIAHHVGQFLNQPVLPVVVVQHNHSVTAQMCPRRRDCVLREQKAFKTQTGVARGECQ